MTVSAISERPGQRFQDLVATLERMFALQDDVTVDCPLRLRDKDTGRLREHDIVITRQTHHGPNLTALECKDHGRRVGVPQIEGFAKKCEKTGIHRGIVVSASGFTKTALVKARALNLTCMALAEAESLDWFGTINIIFQFFQFRSINGIVRLMGNGYEARNPITIHNPDGSPTSGESFQPMIYDGLPPEVRRLTTTQTIEATIIVPMEGFYVVDAVGQRFQVEDVEFKCVLDVEVGEHPMALHNYAGEDTAGLQIASGRFAFPGGQSTVAFVRSTQGITGYLLAHGGRDYRMQIGDLPERRLGQTPPER